MMMQGSNNILGIPSDQNELMMGHSSSDGRRYNEHSFITKQENDLMLPDRVAYNRRTKVRSAGGSIRSEGSKTDEKIVVLHSHVQNTFASLLSNLLNDSAANDLQCCMTYGKPCGCIRKYILAGSQWKEQASLRISSMKDKDQDTIAASDRAALQDVELTRARELLGILHHAAELKKEKCYTTNEGPDGKPTKELRGMIGLGNGRKRSKKYEDFVLDRREVLREKYSLCEKAAQKLLGYSINFLYKKLRTNPQKTSRLVATNKAERAAKSPRHLISLQQLQEMANNQQTSSQCCCRNCINWLVKQHFNKIVDWRRRLEGSGQRVAQQIVAEVLLVSASLDGQNSFCQNLVHWVTGCSFKKIRRVRDHLKKDPKSLPEHGLKKYWKEKGRNKQSKARGDEFLKTIAMKSEKESYLGAQDRFPMQYDARNAMGSDLTNLNNSNNRYDNDVQYIPTTSTTPPPNRPLPPSGISGGMFSGNVSTMRNFSNESTSSAFQQQLQSQLPNQQMYLAQNGNPANLGVLGGSELSGMSSNYPPQHANALGPALPPPTSFPAANSAYNQTATDPCLKDNLVMNQSDPIRRQVSSAAPDRNPHEADPARAQYQEPQNIHDVLPKAEQSKFYPTPFLTGVADTNPNFDNSQPYYFAANPGSSQQEGFLSTNAVAPLFFTQAAQQFDHAGNSEQDGGLPSQFANQPFFILSPAAIPNSSEKNAGDYDNFKPMMMPLTPIHMYPASYLQGNTQSENRDGKNQAWGVDGPQHFVFSAADPNMLYGAQAEQDSNYQPNQAPDGSKKLQQPQGAQQQAYFPAALTPLAMMPSQGNSFFSGWFTTPQPALNTQLSVTSSGQNDEESNTSQQYATLSNANQQKYPVGSSVESQASYLSQQDQYYKPELANNNQSLPSVGQWASTSNSQMFAATQPPPNQWIGTSQNADASQTNSSAQGLPTATAAAGAKDALKGQMPQLAPIDKLPATKFEETASRSLPEVQTFSVSLKNDGKTTEPKPASISSRVKRFSRDRLGASVDSPGIYLPPMTPLTPSLTPNMLAGINAAANPESMPVKTEENPADVQVSESSVFQFPPSHVSRRMAALRVEGVPIDSGENGKPAAGAEKKRGDLPSDGSVGEASKSSASSRASSSQSQTLGSDSNAKQVPLLSIPPSCWATEVPDVKPDSDEGRPDHLKTATLTTPTHQPSPSNLTTPTHQLNTPNKGLNTPTQPLNTPTQPLNTPTDVISPVPLSFLPPSDEKSSPVKPLMPAPAGKKRRADSDFDNSSSPRKQLRASSVGKRDEAESVASGSVSIKKFTAKENNDDLNEKTKAADEGNSDVDVSSASTSAPIKSPVFSLPSAEAGNAPPINTPVFVPSSAILRRASGPDRASSSTPPFFTFVPGSGYSTPMFLAPVEQFDHKAKQAKEKASESGGADNQADKSKASPMKLTPSSLSLCGKYFTDDGLQTPSKIPVVTPSVVLSSGLSADAQQVFCFPQVIPHIYKNSGTPDKNKSKSDEANPDKNLKPSEKTADEEKRARSSVDGNRLRPPSLVVDPPSDNEDENRKRVPPRKSPSPSKIPPGKSDKSPQPAKSPTASKPTLHRTRSGSKKDLVLSLHNLSSADSDASIPPSPLNTPLGLQVITPTLPTSKMSSPIQRLPPSMRVRPQPLIMAPICLTPGGNSNQVTTPTIFQLISPSQAAPQSPSVMLYPYIRSSGPLSTGSIASPAFGFFPKASVPSGSNSASLLKSALMKKLPVFQFPPSVPVPAADTANPEKDVDPSSKETKSATQSEALSLPRDSSTTDEPITKQREKESQ